MKRLVQGLQHRVRRWLDAADAAVNRLYGWRYNPLYHSGAVVIALFLVLLATGLYLLLFYRLGAPYDSVAGITDQVWAGRWIRSLHRYASDAAVIAIAIHAFRMFAQGRSWGPRGLAWLSGLVLLGLVFVLGWSGYVMVWDVQGIVLAREGARLLDALPLFSEPIERTFVGERPLPSAFFFLNLFLHVALPIGLGVLLWLHVARVARPGLLPPKRLMWGVIGLLLALSVLWPIANAPAADVFRLPDRAPYDAFFAFWLPLARGRSVGVVWIAGGLVLATLLLIPMISRPEPNTRLPSSVNERLCTGCEQCYLDCPYEAISMIARPDGREGLVARVDPSLCVSCGICAGSCAPMGVGPPRRTGRDQIAYTREFIERHALGPGHVVVVACSHGAGGVAEQTGFEGALVLAVDCAGSLHTSVIEYLVRSGVGGVLIVACPPRDCRNREGPKWLEQRLFHDREAELKTRVDRARIRLTHAGGSERREVERQLAAFRRAIAALQRPRGEGLIDLDRECEIPAQDVGRP